MRAQIALMGVIRQLGLAALAAIVIGLDAQVAGAAECHHVTMAPRASAGGVALILNGMGVRQATVFNVDVYVAGLYLGAPSRDAASILRDMKSMRMVLELKRDVDRDKMNEAIRKGFERNAGSLMPALEGRVTQLERLVPDLHGGDVVTFDYRPGSPGMLFVSLNGRPAGTVGGIDFARTFFSIWLGDHPPNAALKRGLLGGAC